jgi:hypothetical protein
MGVDGGGAGAKADGTDDSRAETGGGCDGALGRGPAYLP